MGRFRGINHAHNTEEGGLGMDHQVDAGVISDSPGTMGRLSRPIRCNAQQSDKFKDAAS